MWHQSPKIIYSDNTSESTMSTESRWYHLVNFKLQIECGFYWQAQRTFNVLEEWTNIEYFEKKVIDEMVCLNIIINVHKITCINKSVIHF